ncbi:MAG: glycosyltransferase family 2 protein [Winogradskyella sp.]|uniref:glycosyltransferase family 2 protein n=1 Tax=Winogradskyella sp. TaxID=1883156 RepID=UPI0017F1AD3A|nr:glycosyltransferase family 2 protein [Winogradskyella sp.]
MEPFFSVVITVYNKANFILETLKGVLNQNFSDFEVLIVNDGSTDNSLDLIKSITDKRVSIISTTNNGVSTARNIGMKAAKAKYIALSDGDDIWFPNHLSELKRLIESFPDCGIYATSYTKNFFNGNTIKPKFNNIGHPFFDVVSDYFKSSTIDNILWTSAVAIPKKIFDKGYKFDESLGWGEDNDLWIRIALDFKVAFSSESTAFKMIYSNENHLSLTKDIPNLLTMLSKHTKNEKHNTSLKTYLDINRFMIAMEAKLRNDRTSYKLMKSQLDHKNLNYKLRLLLMLPAGVLRFLKQIKFFLLKYKLYHSPFR